MSQDVDARRFCGWCRAAIDARRIDARWCSKACRQAAHRAKFRGVARARATSHSSEPRHIAYADPPYPGKAHLYEGHPDYAGEVDHRDLIRRLSCSYDGWALSTSAAALPMVLAECVAQDLHDVRVAAWAKGRARPHATARVLNAWEPVVWIPARMVAPAGQRDGLPQVEDALIGVASRRRSTLPTAVIGMKPPAFCYWIFDLLAAVPGDTFDDLYPGSGLVSWCWREYASHADPRATPVAPDVERDASEARSA